MRIALGAFGGAVLGWAIFAGAYIEIKRWYDDNSFGWNALKQPVSAAFWRASAFAALVSAAIGGTIAVISLR